MRISPKIIITVLIAALVLGLAMVSKPSLAQTQTPTPTAQRTPTATPEGEPPRDGSADVVRTISVSGVGQVNATPDVAIVRLGVQTEAETASEALDMNSERMSALVAALRSAGVATSDIQTQVVQLFPRYDVGTNNQGTPTPPTLVGYTATNIVEARVRNLDNLGEMLDAAVEAGGNTIENVRFDVSDSTEVMDEARELAMNEALRKAEQLANLAGAELGEVLSINESSRVPSPLTFGGGFDEQSRAVAVPIEPGMQRVEVDIQVTWLLR